MDWFNILTVLLSAVILFLLLRKNSAPQADLQPLREEFRINREETAALMRENRTEWHQSMREFRQETTDLLRSQQEQNRLMLEQINRTLEQRLIDFSEKADRNQRENREELTKVLQDFSQNNTQVLEKVTQTTDQRLKELTEQAKTENKEIREALLKLFNGFQEASERSFTQFNEMQREKFSQLENRQSELIQNTEKKLEQMRETVDEKLQKTLQDRIGQSFEQVSQQLERVQKGLGEMQNLAQDVGGLKKVLSNVKMRGGIGEVQLAMLLEQILAPEQYEANVKTKRNSSELVEFAIRLPGRDQDGTQVYLPIDAKFPKDAYEKLVEAYEIGDVDQIEAASKNIEQVIKKMAKDISEKYLDPPFTTDFGIMFLPFEGIYAEVIRRSHLMEQLQREYKVVVTGPTTLAAILNSFQMGFRTLAIQKRSSEVWNVLGAVKSEFEKFGGLLEKAQKNITQAGSTLEDLIGTRTRAITRTLRDIEKLPESEAVKFLPDAGSFDDSEG